MITAIMYMKRLYISRHGVIKYIGQSCIAELLLSLVNSDQAKHVRKKVARFIQV